MSLTVYLDIRFSKQLSINQVKATKDIRVPLPLKGLRCWLAKQPLCK